MIVLATSLDQTLSREVTQLHAEFCSAIADVNRILILYVLHQKPTTVNELAQAIGVSQPTASRHLKILRDSGLVQAERQGINVEYRLADPRVIEALDTLRAILRDQLAQRANMVDELFENV
jgi:ArsR family transcriptional regulator